MILSLAVLAVFNPLGGGGPGKSKFDLSVCLIIALVFLRRLKSSINVFDFRFSILLGPVFISLGVSWRGELVVSVRGSGLGVSRKSRGIIFEY